MIADLQKILQAFIEFNQARGRELVGDRERRILYIILAIQSQRYLAPRNRRLRPTNRFIVDLNPEPIGTSHQPWLNETEFLSAYRMQRPAFQQLCALIEGHPVFQYKGLGPRQAKVSDQLMVFLNYLGTSGSGASHARARKIYHIGYGTSVVYINRCKIAIRSTMRKEFYNWPNEEERKEIAKEIKEIYEIPNCIGHMDGTTFATTYEPQREDAADFKGRKPGYTLSVLIVGNHKRRI
jgi:hypothetical protein